MSDGGGGESVKEIESCLKKRRKHDEFAQAIARIAVAQVCEGVGFQGFQQSALDRLSDVACKYILEIGKTSKFYANLAGRTECNVFDIVQGLEDLSLPQGFVGASDRDHCLSGSGLIKEISQYVSLSEEIGFAYSVPSFPVIKERNSTPSFLQAGETPPTDAIPPWLPRFPDPKTYTYSSMPSADMEETQMRPDRIEQEHKVLEPPSSRLEQLWACSESELPLVIDQGDNVGRERGSNPFLNTPLQPGEKEISLVSLPAKLKEEDMVQNHGLWANHVSALNTFGPANQAVKSCGCDAEEGSRKVLLNNRPALQMKFHIGKKSLDIANRHNYKGKEEVASWFVNDDVGDAKEKRTEKLPREPMDIEEHTGNDSVVN
ncbi:transcription initiation factor TFIID subunit 8-like [Cynara cardunculus var. scolymus]|uniref:Transcription initiation factor TFIID subunit 8 n=1 Tax=Cynara cardunculus var. scolymus TaxID=59895 RepID=A0A103XKX9_CYNCS|nr:transcription initiation factor TFIID subunit 8-like [Cynara cardunculus var. scolymus]KVH92656.1 Bromodomain transcription factor [Cynara cardunculus var. scolymus]